MTEALREALQQIADQDPVELTLDPQWSQRIARAALEAKRAPQVAPVAWRDRKRVGEVRAWTLVKACPSWHDPAVWEYEPLYAPPALNQARHEAYAEGYRDGKAFAGAQAAIGAPSAISEEEHAIWDEVRPSKLAEPVDDPTARSGQGSEADLSNIESPFNACMHREHCLGWKRIATSGPVDQVGAVAQGPEAAIQNRADLSDAELVEKFAPNADIAKIRSDWMAGDLLYSQADMAFAIRAAMKERP